MPAFFDSPKNRFNDVGMTSSDIEELCLKYDCSNEALVNYNYQRAFNERYPSLAR